MQDDTVDLALGIGRIRWGDDSQTVLARYPGARPTKPREGVEPATGRRISIPVGLRIQPLLQLGSLRLWATAHFGSGGVTEVSLHPDNEEAVDPPAVLAQARELCARLGVGPVDPGKMTQSWGHGAVEVELFLEHDDFSITIAVLGRQQTGADAVGHQSSIGCSGKIGGRSALELEWRAFQDLTPAGAGWRPCRRAPGWPES